MPMRVPVSDRLLARSRTVLFHRDGLSWVVGGAGSGKTTVCDVLSARLDIPVYDMDAHIYGSYHGRFTHERHPVNEAWSKAPNGLAWLLDKSRDEFEGFNRGALPEYLDLLAEDLAATDPHSRVLIDGGICDPALLAQVIPPRRIVCLSRPGRSSEEIWTETGERRSMKEEIDRLPRPEDAWRTFLGFDDLITRAILRQCRENDIAVCPRGETGTAEELADRVARVLGILPGVA
jgi:hypothetical protein